MSHIENFWLTDADTNPNNRHLCCGCGGCAIKCPKSAITLKKDSEGFVYPRLDESKCVNCGLCSKNCPVGKGKDKPFLKTFAGYALDNNILSQTTSGGIITLISQKAVELGWYVAGVKYDNDFGCASYYLASTLDEVNNFSKSKYIQSQKNNIFFEIQKKLDSGEKVLFTGCPCDASSLKRFLNFKCENLYIIELVCMGVSAPKILVDYKKIVESRYRSKITDIVLRSKKKGWFVPHLEVSFQNNKKILKPLYGTIIGYSSQVYNRPSCFSCEYRGTVGEGDIRVGDFWGIKKDDPYWNSNGVSCIFVRNEKGLELLNLVSSDKCYLYEVNYKVATEHNMSSFKNKGNKYKMLRDRFSDIYKKSGLAKACYKTASFSFWVRRFLPSKLTTTAKRFYHKIIEKKHA